MAIGMGRMLGFRFPENFNNPYVSRSITEFWRRWHMTLGAFFREYLYIPLGGNRVGRARLVFNLLLVWALTGLWHGASWSFIAWGALYGVVIIAERFIGMERLERIPTGLRIAGTLLLVMCGWSLFYNPTLAAGFANIAAMFGIGAVGVADAAAIYVLKRNLLLVLFAATACLPWAGYLTRYMESRSRWTRGKRALAMALPVLSLVLLLLSVTFLVGQSFNPFMYFRF
jgi:alginate O-acetyltransferase complex protein AlgI